MLQGVAPGLQAGRQVAEGGREIRVWVRIQVPQELVPVLGHDAAVLRGVVVGEAHAADACRCSNVGVGFRA